MRGITARASASLEATIPAIPHMERTRRLYQESRGTSRASPSRDCHMVVHARCHGDLSPPSSSETETVVHFAATHATRTANRRARSHSGSHRPPSPGLRMGCDPYPLALIDELGEHFEVLRSQ